MLCNPDHARLLPSTPSHQPAVPIRTAHTQDIIQRWAALPLSVQAAVFDAALITAAEGSWALLEQQLQLVLDVAGA